MNKTYVQPVLHKATTEWLRLNVAPHLKDQFAIEKLAKEIKAIAPEFDEKHFVSYAKEEERSRFRLFGGRNTDDSLQKFDFGEGSEFEITITQENDKTFVRAISKDGNIDQSEQLLSKINESLS